MRFRDPLPVLLVTLGILAAGLSEPSRAHATPAPGPSASSSTAPSTVAPEPPPPAAQEAPVVRTASGTTAPEPDANTCLTCHLTLPDARLRAVAEQFQESVHRDERIGCAGCHQGRPTDPTVSAHDPDAGFVVRPRHEHIAELCGGCHSDPVFVRRFRARLPIDQQKLYRLSRHGQLASAGDAHAPTCSDCHGTHGILSVASPEAPVHGENVVALCGRCHADPKRMAPYRLETRQVAEWKSSVHGVAFEGGNRAAPTCTGCHSPHAGKLPGSAAVEALCNRCHTDERDLFMQSPHAKAFRRLGLGECVPCHGSHAVRPPDRLAGMSADSACARCHAHDDTPRKTAERIGELLGSVDALTHDAAADLAAARRDGLYVPDAAHGLARARSARLGLAAQVHTLDTTRIATAVRAVRPVVDEVHRKVEDARRERQRERRGYFAALGVAGLLFVLLVLKALELARRSPPAS